VHTEEETAAAAAEVIDMAMGLWIALATALCVFFAVVFGTESAPLLIGVALGAGFLAYQRKSKNPPNPPPTA
jgi:hypothetical protein